MKAKDSDSAINGNNVVTYSILEGGEGMFQIDSTTGWITTVKKLNASVRETYALVVQATDSKSLLSVSLLGQGFLKSSEFVVFNGLQYWLFDFI